MSAWLPDIDRMDLGQAILETLAMVGGSLALSVIVGLPIGIALFLTAPGRLLARRGVHTVLAFAVNLLRSAPFVILLILMIPFTRFLVGTSLGVQGAIPPLVAGAAPFFARLVETALAEVDAGVIEAARAMGATPRQIVTRFLLPEALPGIIAGATVTAVALVSYSAMAGVVGAGGLGDLAIRFGYQRFQTDVMVVTIVLLVIVVQLLQAAGDRLVAHFRHR